MKGINRNTVKVLGSNRSKAVALVVSILAVLVLLVGVLYLWDRTRPYNSQGLCTGSESSPIYQKMDGLSDPFFATKLKKVVDEIRKQPGFTNDPNCLYPLVIYYANISDEVNARKMFNQLKTVYLPRRGFVKALGKDTLNIKQLQQKVEFAESQRRTIEGNLSPSETKIKQQLIDASNKAQN